MIIFANIEIHAMKIANVITHVNMTVNALLINYIEKGQATMKKRHLTPYEIKEQMKHIAREKRMADRSPYSAMSIVCLYSLMIGEGFKGKRISDVANNISKLEQNFYEGKADVDKLKKQLWDKAEWTVDYKQYTEEDIHHRKGSFDYYMDQIQIEPQNRINKHAERYLIFFFVTLIDLYGYGKDRLTRVEKELNELLTDYANNKCKVSDWNKALFDEAGVYIEMPIDPLTQERGSMMTGGTVWE